MIVKGKDGELRMQQRRLRSRAEWTYARVSGKQFKIEPLMARDLVWLRDKLELIL